MVLAPDALLAACTGYSGRDVVYTYVEKNVTNATHYCA